jgi:uncharacterized protein
MGSGHRLVQRARQVRSEHAPEVPSPCISVCRIDPVTQWCEGCFRTLDEVAGWSRMSDDEKREVWWMIEQRALTPALSQREREKNQDTQSEST